MFEVLLEHWAAPAVAQSQLVRLQAQIVGLAGGYIYGGLVGTALGWRWAFYIQVVSLILLIAASWNSI